MEQKINSTENSAKTNFVNPLTSVNNIYNNDVHLWPKNTILIGRDSMIDGINEKSLSKIFKSVIVRCFGGATIDDMYFYLIPLLNKKQGT